MPEFASTNELFSFSVIFKEKNPNLNLGNHSVWRQSSSRGVTSPSCGQLHDLPTILYDFVPSWTQWTWVWVNCGSWWWTRRPGVLQSMGLQRVGHDWVAELNWTAMGLRSGRQLERSSRSDSCLHTGEAPLFLHCDSPDRLWGSAKVTQPWSLLPEAPAILYHFFEKGKFPSNKILRIIKQTNTEVFWLKHRWAAPASPLPQPTSRTNILYQGLLPGKSMWKHYYRNLGKSYRKISPSWGSLLLEQFSILAWENPFY